ncbi:MAG: hypothetical protein J5802_14760 [Butyrivibrio sp.]|nr:hypothetical protein [Butyrivibrio sp.]
MKNIIFGVGDFADILFQKLIDVGIEVDAFCIDEKYYKDISCKTQRPLVFYEDIKKQCIDDVGIYIGVIGKNCMFELRKNVFERISRDGYRILNFIDPSAIVRTSNIGLGNIIMENVVVEAHCSIGDGNIIWPNVVMPHHNTIGSFNNISPSVSLSGYSSVGNQCFIGNNACLNNHIHVFDKGLVGAGVFVRTDLEADSVLVSPQSYILDGRKSWEFK